VQLLAVADKTQINSHHPSDVIMISQ